MRAYTRSQVDRLVLIRRALLCGHRPGRLLALPAPERDALLATFVPGPDAAPRGRSEHLLPLADGLLVLRQAGADALRPWLTGALVRTGLAGFVLDGLAPLALQVSQARLSGRLAQYEQQLFGEVVQSVLRAGMLAVHGGIAAAGPRVLLTTLPGDGHGLGLLMAEALLWLEGCRCLPLGAQTPVGEIDAACRAHAVDVVALGFSPGAQSAASTAQLLELRGRLRPTVAVWAGGNWPLRPGAETADIQVLPQLGALPAAVARWRAHLASAAGAATD